MNPSNYENIIILRSVFGKGGLKTPIKCYITPCPDPKTGRFPDCVRKVDSHGDMILSEADKEKQELLIPEDYVFVVQDGTSFNLDDPRQKVEWEAIKHCKMIAPSRDARDASGKLIIDGEDSRKMRNYNTLQSARYGMAELYIERPGEDTQKKVSKRKLKLVAENFIFDDSQEGVILKARLLGRDMRNAHLADIQDYLLDIAERDPQRIVNLYTGDDMNLRLLLLDAIQRRVIVLKNKLYIYADGVVLGASEDAVLTWFKQPGNAKIVDLIKKETHPEVYEITDPVKAKVFAEADKQVAAEEAAKKAAAEEAAKTKTKTTK
ncbi:MAG: hypothetical protein Nk1A_8720 [Endomicrobiia bacterium]|nr:MAG: hypothetical protein Nk1A_8720 [Endomicrobiia bacterium]